MRCAKECDHSADCTFDHNAKRCEEDALFQDVTLITDSPVASEDRLGGTLTVTFDTLPYKIQTHGSGLCFELFEKKPKRIHKGKEVAEGWTSLGSYPTTIKRAAELVIERALLADPGEYDLEAAVQRVKEVTREVSAAVNA